MKKEVIDAFNVVRNYFDGVQETTYPGRVTVKFECLGKLPDNLRELACITLESIDPNDPNYRICGIVLNRSDSDKFKALPNVVVTEQMDVIRIAKSAI